jgi:hypothetical protein
MILIPFWLAWSQGYFKWAVELPVYAPTGAYNSGQLASTGLGYWTFSPTVSVSYLSQKTGLEVTAFAAMDLNTENTGIDYQSGDVFHLDLTVAEHLPLFGCFIGIGANAWYWQQITGDSGSGAKLGSFEGRTVRVGPVLSYTYPIGGHNVVAEVKWLPELETQNRLKGDSVWFKVAFAF